MKTEEYIKLIQEGNLTKAEEVRQSTIPAKLIKFFWLDGSETDEKKFQTLAEDKIWFSHKQFLNDPYEFKGMMIDRKKMSDAGYLLDKSRALWYHESTKRDRILLMLRDNFFRN